MDAPFLCSNFLLELLLGSVKENCEDIFDQFYNQTTVKLKVAFMMANVTSVDLLIFEKLIYFHRKINFVAHIFCRAGRKIPLKSHRLLVVYDYLFCLCLI